FNRFFDIGYFAQIKLTQPVSGKMCCGSASPAATISSRTFFGYSIPDGKGRFYASMPLTAGMTKAMCPNQWYELINPKTGTGYLPPEGRVWVHDFIENAAL